MKANETPEKIYLFENPIEGTPDYRCLSKRSSNEDIEYTRTDVFIEKACEWLEENLFTYWSQVNANDTEEFIDKFKKVMGE